MGKVSGFFMAMILSLAACIAFFSFFSAGAGTDAYNITLDTKYQDFNNNITAFHNETAERVTPIVERLDQSSGNSIVQDAFLTKDILAILKLPITFFELLVNILNQVSLIIGLPSVITTTAIIILAITVVFMIVNGFRGGGA